MSTLLKVGQMSVGQTSVGQMSVAEKSRHRFQLMLNQYQYQVPSVTKYPGPSKLVAIIPVFFNLASVKY
jgi:hypothetical protein